MDIDVIQLNINCYKCIINKSNINIQEGINVISPNLTFNFTKNFSIYGIKPFIIKSPFWKCFFIKYQSIYYSLWYSKYKLL